METYKDIKKKKSNKKSRLSQIFTQSFRTLRKSRVLSE